ncbi:MAG: ParB/RepB/Spo0J family partition protein, partial [Pseudomonadota bacterium]
MPDPATETPQKNPGGAAEPAGAGGKRSHLGRGLDALFGEEPEENYGSLDKLRQTRTVPISRLRANPDQPRRLFDQTALAELVASVEAQGVLTPLLVRPIEGREDEFEIVAGERRWRAAQQARLHEVPVVILALDILDQPDFQNLAVVQGS